MHLKPTPLSLLKPLWFLLPILFSKANYLEPLFQLRRPLVHFPILYVFTLSSIISCLFSSPRLAPGPRTHRFQRLPPYVPRPALARGCGWRKRGERGGQVLLPVRRLVQQPTDGPAALRGQETPQERGQGAAPRAASGQSGCHGEHRSASRPRHVTGEQQRGC